MDPEMLVLLILDAAGGIIRGKTLLQKRGYFLSVTENAPLKYVPHYYGPYSFQLENGLNMAKSLGFVSERTASTGSTDQRGFEVRRHDFELTDQGKEVVQFLKQQFPEDYNRFVSRLKTIGEVDNADYHALSIAAKADYLLRAEGDPMTEEAIREKAKGLGWQIKQKEIDGAVKLLQQLDLVVVSPCEL